MPYHRFSEPTSLPADRAAAHHAGLLPTPPELARPSTMQMAEVCRTVRYLVAEMIVLAGERVRLRQDRRRMLCHVRQIAMYVCHVALSLPQNEIGQAFGRDRTTVGHACHVVEDRRDDAVYDEFIASIERLVSAIFARMEVPNHD